MDILNNNKHKNIQRNEIEQVQKKKHEYKLLSSYERTKGLKLFIYNPNEDSIKELEIKFGTTAYMVWDDLRKKHTWIDIENQKCQIDSRNTPFECLNMKNAINRVTKWKAGKIKELCNLKEPSNNSINFW